MKSAGLLGVGGLPLVTHLIRTFLLLVTAATSTYGMALGNLILVEAGFKAALLLLSLNALPPYFNVASTSTSVMLLLALFYLAHAYAKPPWSVVSYALLCLLSLAPYAGLQYKSPGLSRSRVALEVWVVCYATGATFMAAETSMKVVAAIVVMPLLTSLLALHIVGARGLGGTFVAPLPRRLEVPWTRRPISRLASAVLSATSRSLRVKLTVPASALRSLLAALSGVLSGGAKILGAAIIAAFYYAEEVLRALSHYASMSVVRWLVQVSETEGRAELMGAEPLLPQGVANFVESLSKAFSTIEVAGSKAVRLAFLLAEGLITEHSSISQTFLVFIAATSALLLAILANFVAFR